MSIETTPQQERRHEARRQMKQRGWQLMVVGPSAGFKYLTGRKAILTERFVALVVGQDGRDFIVTPRLQAPLYEGIQGIEVVVWDEADDPVDVLVAMADGQGAQSVAFNDEFWANFLLRFHMKRQKTALCMGGELLSDMRIVKSAGELERMAAASRKIDEVWSAFCESVGPVEGQTELALRSHLDGIMRDLGFSEVSWVDVGAGANGASPLHHGSDYVIRAGDPVVIDYAGCFDDYFGDICRVAVTGPVDPAYQALYDLVRHAQESAFQAVQPGVEAQRVDAIARDILAAQGYGEFFTHRLGHGIGLAAHEEPYLVSGNARLLEPGMVFSNEPGVYLPGRWGVRIEDIVVVTQNAGRRLNEASRDIARIG